MENETRLESLVNVLEYEACSVQDFLNHALEEAIRLTESDLGYIYFFDKTKKEFLLKVWSKNVMGEYLQKQPEEAYFLEKTGIRAEVVLRDKPVMINDFVTPNSLKKAYLEGHVALRRFLSVPVHSGGKIVAVIGVANKESEYTRSNLYELTLLMDTVWHVADRIESESALVHAAQEWRSTFDSISDMIAIIDAEYKIRRVNRSFARALGTDPQMLIGQHCYKVVHGFDDSHPYCPHWRTIRTKHDESSEYYDEQLKMWVEATASPIFDGDGKFTGSVHIIKNISVRKQAEVEQEQLRHRAEVSSRLAAVGEMAAGIAHEINNPLTGVIGFSELLLERNDLPQDVKSELEVINNGSQRVKEIVKRMLTFARQSTPTKTCSNIEELIDNTIELRSYVLRTSNIQVVKDFESNLPLVTVDAGQIQQVFLNLIVNAEFAMKSAHGKGTLTLTTARVKDRIKISISDDGPGFSKETKAKLFQPFFTTKEPGEGTGLGLSLSMGIIQEHGGTITAESEPGEGATFTIELPITICEQPVGEPDYEPPSRVKLDRSRILVVDDEPTIRDLIKTILISAGHTVDECNDASHVLDKLANAYYDVVLLDLRMPGMSGMELYDQIKDRWIEYSNRVIFITGDTSDQGTREFLSLHHIPFITKPFSRKALEAKIQEVLG